eukprot:COSAG04_NODE_2104_length_4778_cov_3.530883_7_plen_268_part_01
MAGWVQSLLRCDFAELTERDGGRLDMRFRMNEPPFSDPSIVFNPLWFPLVRELLGGETESSEGEGGGIRLLYACVMAAEGTGRDSASTSATTAQKWHADGGHIFEHAHQPPHCINVFVPLDDLTDANGPTEFVAGTHVLHAFDDKAAAPKRPSFAAKAKAGGAVLFDYRLKHRGGLNSSPRDRLLLCLCYAKPWFQDLGNPRSRQPLMEEGQGQLWVPRLLRHEVARAMLERGPDAVAPAAEAAPASLGPAGEAGGGTVREQWVLFEV